MAGLFDDIPMVTEKPSASRDMARGLGKGVVEGVAGIAGIPGDAARFLGAEVAFPLANKVRGWMGKEPIPAPEAAPEWLPAPMRGSQAVQSSIEQNVTGPLEDPQTLPGQYARTVGQFLPGAVMTPGGMIGNAIKYGVIPGLASEAAGQLTKGTKVEPYARMAGGVGGAMLSDIGKRLITPNPISPDRQKMVDTLASEGIEMTAGQKTGSKPLKYMESAASQVPGGGGRMASVQGRQSEQYTQAILKRMGVDAPRATPEVIDAALSRMGGEFDRLAANNTLRMDRKFAQEFGRAIDDYRNLVSPANQVPIVEKYARDIVDVAKSTQMIEGPAYQQLRSTLGQQATAAYKSGNAALGEVLFKIQGSLDDAMARSAPQADRDAWNNVRRQYSVWKTIMPAVTAAGEGAAEGLLSPSAVRNAVKGKNATAYARGKGDLAEVARAGEAVLKPLPDSGTAGRAGAMSTLAALGGAGGYLAGGLPGTGAGVMAATVAEPVLKALGARAIQSAMGQKYLGNQLFATPVDPAQLTFQAGSAAARIPYSRD